MKTNLKTVVLASLLLTCWSVSAQEISANVGLTSDYMWRGLTQNDGDASLSAGLDYSAGNGFYIGTWAANVVDGLDIEIDGFLGWAGESESGFTWDVGYVYYSYTGESDANFGEIYAAGGYKAFTLKYSYDAENENGYIEGNLDFSFPGDYSAGLHLGDYDYDNGASATDWSVYAGKDWRSLNFQAAYADLDMDIGPFNIEDDAFYASVTWTWSAD